MDSATDCTALTRTGRWVCRQSPEAAQSASLSVSLCVAGEQGDEDLSVGGSPAGDGVPARSGLVAGDCDPVEDHRVVAPAVPPEADGSGVPVNQSRSREIGQLMMAQRPTWRVRVIARYFT